MKNSTLDYYNLNAESYFELTSSIELSSTYDSVEKYFVEKTGVLIDLGSGSGRDSNQLILRKYNVISVDLSEKLLKISKKKFDLEKVCLADFMKLPFKNRAVKYIFASASLLHIPKKYIDIIFSGLYEILEKKGKIFFSLKKGVSENSDENKRFFAYYSEFEILKIMERNKFNSLEISTIPSADSRKIEWIMVFAEKM